MNNFREELLACLGKEAFEKLGKIKTGIAGAGGLGSNCAAFLVRSGFRKLKIYDFDKVSYSNLNRQFYFYDQVGHWKVDALRVNLSRIDPDLELETFNERVTNANVSGAFADCDIVIEAFDRAENKKMLTEAYMNSGKLYISASGIAGCGDSDNITIKKIHDKFFLIGDGVSEASAALPPFAPRVNIAAAKEADIALSWALRKGTAQHG
ncbi:MAG: thiamine biosynthesis protein ThiF [Lentisphaerae bacterium GWF2_45_14]|nr:MAG: thiamine biosynthesis protein ThiF [Lentisphaerae bacterium GWF2_45_14]